MTRTQNEFGKATHAHDDKQGHQLTTEDEMQLERLEEKLQLVRDRTVSVVRGFQTGFYLYGDGGSGKSFTVLEELRRQKANYVLSNSRMTGRGLFDALKRMPDAIHVLEDMEQLFRDSNAQGVLRSALWGQQKKGQRGPQERVVTWSTSRKEHRFYFMGGIIMIANRPLEQWPELEAIKTRIACMHLQPTDRELAALMRHISLKGHEHNGSRMDPQECLEVCEYVISQSLALCRPLDLRLLMNSFADYLQWQETESGCHWKDLVATRLREWPTLQHSVEATDTKKVRKQKELEIAKTLNAITDREERLRRWEKETGKSEQTLYRRLAELNQRDFSISQQ